MEYLFDDDQDNDWEDEVHSFDGFDLTLRSRYSTVGISRVSHQIIFEKSDHVFVVALPVNLESSLPPRQVPLREDGDRG